MAVWRQSDGTRFNVLARRFDGAEWSVAVPFETENEGDAAQPRLFVAPNGDAIAVWSQSDGPRGNIWVNQFRWQ